MKNKSIEIGGMRVAPGERETIHIPVAPLVTHQDVQLTTQVINGKQSGPCLFICAAIHGDEINGVEIIRRLLKLKQLQRLRGTLIAIPIVNVHGFLTHSRYLPDGRDLNRSFPGNKQGSLAGRVASTFLEQIVSKCTHGVDLHTGSRHRGNLPQVRADLENPENKRLALAFGVPAVIDSKIRDGSLRQAGGDAGIPILLYEAGEALRFDEISIGAGVRGILNLMRELKMLPPSKYKTPPRPAMVSHQTSWVRAPNSGILRCLVPLGVRVDKHQVLGIIANPLGSSEYSVLAPEEGFVIGRTFLPLAHEGDALFHLAHYDKPDQVEHLATQFQNMLDPEEDYGWEPNEAPIH